MLPYALYSDIQNLLVSASAIRHCEEAAGRLDDDKDLLQEEKVHSGVAEHVREAGGCLGAEEDLLREE
jgi:hypothetical protein